MSYTKNATQPSGLNPGETARILVEEHIAYVDALKKLSRA